MSSLGERLKDARERRRLSLEEAAAATKIKESYLDAMERDAFDLLPAPTYAKGFLGIYARALGLDDEALAREFLETHAGRSPSTLETERLDLLTRAHRSPLRRYLPHLALASAALLAVVLLLHRRARRREPEVGFPEIEVEEAGKPAPAVEEKGDRETVPKEMTLTASARDRVWMRVRADGRIVFERLLPKGRKERWRASDRFELRIGNPSSVSIWTNGVPVRGLEGVSGPKNVTILSPTEIVIDE